jgi:hypothetical protein
MRTAVSLLLSILPLLKNLLEQTKFCLEETPVLFQGSSPVTMYPVLKVYNTSLASYQYSEYHTLCEISSHAPLVHANCSFNANVSFKTNQRATQERGERYSTVKSITVITLRALPRPVTRCSSKPSAHSGARLAISKLFVFLLITEQRSLYLHSESSSHRDGPL